MSAGGPFDRETVDLSVRARRGSYGQQVCGGKRSPVLPFSCSHWMYHSYKLETHVNLSRDWLRSNYR